MRVLPMNQALILLTLQQTQRELSAAELRARIPDLPKSSVYAAIDKLLTDSRITMRWDTTTLPQARRVFAITPDGKKALAYVETAIVAP